MDTALVDVTEQKRLNDAREARIPWKKWGPYLSERQWGTGTRGLQREWRRLELFHPRPGALGLPSFRPMRGKPALGLLVHPRLRIWISIRILESWITEVCSAVAVALGGRDEILEAARDHRPALVDQPQRAIDVGDVVDDDAEGHHVGQLLEADVPLGHLLPDRIRMLLAAHDLGFEAVVGEIELKSEADPVDEVAALVVSCFSRRVIEA